MFKNVTTLIFDLDGTLIEFSGGRFKDSELSRRIFTNAELFLCKKLDLSKEESKNEIQKINRDYKDGLSVGIEKKYSIARDIYFNTVWDIKDNNLVIITEEVKNLLIYLNKKYTLYLLSDAPIIWIDYAFSSNSLDNIFQNRIFSGEGNNKKSNKKAFSFFIKQTNIDPLNCISIGDQEKTDIVPAKEIGMRTILVSKTKINSQADLVIRNLGELTQYL